MHDDAASQVREIVDRETPLAKSRVKWLCNDCCGDLIDLPPLASGRRDATVPYRPSRKGARGR
jgi:hypothetical protein